MKKMNLNFLGLRSKIVLPLFMIMGLFLLGANNSNAQTIVVKKNNTTNQLLSSEKGFYKSVFKHVRKLPVTVSGLLPFTKSSKEAINDPRIAKDAKITLERTYGKLILSNLGNGSKSEKAIEEAYSVLKKKIPTEYLDPVRNVYKQML